MKIQTLIPALALAVSSQLAVAETRPNIVFIMTDDLGWRDLGATGSAFYQTPNIDRLAEQGMLFTDAYAANPLCSPTRAGALTGLYPQRTGFTAPGGHRGDETFTYRIAPRAQAWARAQNATSASRLDTSFTTYATLLRDAGYTTGHFGKWHVGFSPYMAEDHGFDVDIPRWNVPGPGAGYVYPWNMPGQPQFPGEPGEHLEERMGREIAAFIRANRENPFFVNYWAFTPHSPYDARPDLVMKHAERVDRTDPQQSATMAAMLESLDIAVGYILDALEEEGVRENTVIIFTSDNGGSAFGDSDGVLPTSNVPLKAGKGTIYEGGTRVPLIIEWPGVTVAGTVSSAMVQTTDFFASFLEMAGLPLPEDYPGDGVSIVPVLSGEKEFVRDTIFCYFPHNVDATGNLSGASIRRGDFKLIRFFVDSPDGTDRLELYDLAEDLGETRNLAETMPELAAELNELLTEYLEKSDSLIPGKNPAYNPNARRPWEVEALHGEPPASGPRIGNASFEEPVIDGGEPSLDRTVPGFAAATRETGWTFGFFTGISRENAGIAEGVSAADGSQVAFLQGDRALVNHEAAVRHIFGTDIVDLIPGRTYELSWQQTGLLADRGTGALTVALNVPERRSFPLVRREPVKAQGEWEMVMRPFIAISPTMRLNFIHAVAEAADADPGTVTTLIDDIRIRERNSPISGK